MKLNRTAKLQKLAEMVRDADLDRLGNLTRKMASLKKEIDWINRPMSSLSPEDPFARSGSEGNWNEWRIMRTAELNRQLALLRAEHEEFQTAARRSVSRCEVLKKLEGKLGQQKR